MRPWRGDSGLLFRLANNEETPEEAPATQFIQTNDVAGKAIAGNKRKEGRYMSVNQNLRPVVINRTPTIIAEQLVRRWCSRASVRVAGPG